MFMVSSLLSRGKLLFVLGLALAVLVATQRSSAQAGAPGVISTQSLVDQMLNPDSLAEFHAYANTSGLESSDDPRKRTSYFFSDTDGGNYQRDIIGASGHTEHVMIDMTGPGALTRFFLAGPQAAGYIRFYMDGSTTPVATIWLDSLMEGSDQHSSNSPLRYTAGPNTILVGGTSPNGQASQVPPGLDLYMPIPFANHILVTYDGPSNHDSPNYPILDYIWEYTRFLPGTGVTSWNGQAASSLNTYGKLTPVQTQQENSGAPVLEGGIFSDSNLRDPFQGQPQDSNGTVAVPANGYVYVNIPGNGGSAIRFLQANLGTNNSDLEDLVLTMDFNSNGWEDYGAVNEAIGDFFGSGEGLHPGTTQMQSVGSDGTMQMRWTMPFQNQATIVLTNNSSHTINVRMLADIGFYNWDSYSMHFHAIRRINGPMYMHSSDNDMTMAHTMRMMYIRGTGTLVGDSETVINEQPSGDNHFNWWGEGDELMYVDRSPFPTHRGTGSEDYFGYAYGHTYLFQSPWTSQTSVPPQTSPGQFDYDGGATVLNRARLLDTVPFNDTFRYDFEIHENSDPNAQILVDHTSYFYIVPSSSFQVIPDGVQDGQIYTIESKQNGWILSAHGGAAATTDVPGQTGNQMFKLHLVSGNTYNLESVGTPGQYLSCCRSDGNTPTYLFLYTLNGSSGSCDQQWTINAEVETGTNIPAGPTLGTNDYQTLVNGCNNAADVVSAGTAAGTEVQGYTNNTGQTSSGGDSSQVWRFNYVPPSWLSGNEDPIVPNGVYEIRNTLSPNLAIDVPNASTAVSQPLQVYNSNGTNAQLWTVNYIANGVYSLVNVNSNLALDNAGGGSGTTAVQYTYTTGQNQQWIFRQQNTSSDFFIQNLANQQYLSMGGGQGPGSPLTQANMNAIPWQAWFFQPFTY